MDHSDLEDLLDLLEDSFLAHPIVYRERGVLIHAQDIVQLSSKVGPGAQFNLAVQGTLEYNVAIRFENDDTVLTECNCPVEDDCCKHTAAAILTLIAEWDHDLDNLRDSFFEDSIVKRPEPKITIAEESELEKRLRATTTESLKMSDLRFLRSVIQVYHDTVPHSKTVSGGQINTIFGQHGWPHWDRLTLWAETPEDDHEFWLYLVHFAFKNRKAIPSFMVPVSDLERIASKLAAWERSKAIDDWSGLFQESEAPLGLSGRDGMIRPKQELQLKFGSSEAILEWREDTTSGFTPIPKNPLKSLNQSLWAGRLNQLNSASELLFRRLTTAESMRVAQKLKYKDHLTNNILSGLFQQSNLESVLISPSGEPFTRPTTDLKWRLEEIDKGSGKDYQLKLTNSDGDPLNSPLLIIEGEPSYALTNAAAIKAHTNPRVDLQRLISNPILPAEAVESPEGIRFFDQLRVDLPKQLTKRIKRVPLKIRIQCEIENMHREECQISIQSVLPEGRIVGDWAEDEWIPRKSIRTSRAKAKKQVTIYDDSQLLAAGRILNTINTKFIPFRNTHNLPITRKFPETFSKWLKDIPEGIETELKGELAAFEDQAVVGKMRLEVEESEKDWFDLKVVLDLGDTDLSPEEIQLLLAANGKWVRLKDKGWRRLEYNLGEDEDMDFARLGLNPKELTDEPQRLHALQLANPAAQSLLPDDQAQAVQRRVDEIQTRVTPKKPRGIKADLRPYQLEGYHFLAYLSTNGFGGILADDMGLGKTVQALSWLLWLRGKKKKPIPPSLVVCPKSVMDNWGMEATKFAPTLKVQVWTAGTVKNLPGSVKSADLHVINYSHLRSIGEEIQKISFLTIILDEGQYIKNPSSQTAKTARALRSEHRLVLTGTPIENQALDLWSLMSFAMPGVLGNRSQFGKLYDSKKDPLARLRLSSRVRPFLIRRTKSQVAQDLPERIEDVIHCEIEGTQRKLYDAELKRAQQILLKAKTQKQLSELRFNFLTSLLRLRQICAHPRLHHKTTRAESAKVSALLELLEPIMEEGAKVLVFSQFVELIHILEKELAKKKIKTWTLTGSTENRGDLVKDFQGAKDPGVFLISLKAGGSGLNLTAASYVVLFDPWWNPAVEAQAIDRTHRIGQTSKIIAYRLVVKNTIEEKIRSLQEEKQALVADVLGDEKFSQSLSLNDFQYLLED
jgi:SNF2 family DNA or RNA helicase